ncbi:MAG: hypothetical protein QNJ45_15375 [Ardenticatenaceae bacterium]|nr:hypothetical protein [Ardenticatenaceae bacterium]
MSRNTGSESIPWMWIGLGFVVTIVAVWLAVWIISLALSRDPLPTAVSPAPTVIRLTAPATAVPSPTSSLATPTSIPTLTPSPTPDRKDAPEIITSGFFAQVVGTGEIGLSVRSGASTVNDLLVIAPEESIILVLDGPIENGDFRWWQVELADGTVGFAVERFMIPAAEPENWR